MHGLAGLLTWAGWRQAWVQRSHSPRDHPSPLTALQPPGATDRHTATPASASAAIRRHAGRGRSCRSTSPSPAEAARRSKAPTMLPPGRGACCYPACARLAAYQRRQNRLQTWQRTLGRSKSARIRPRGRRRFRPRGIGVRNVRLDDFLSCNVIGHRPERSAYSRRSARPSARCRSRHWLCRPGNSA